MSRVLLVATILLILVAGEGHATDTSQRTQIIVGSELDYPPYALVTEDGQADGFSVDLMKAVSEVMGIDVTFRVGPWSEVRAALENGEIDALPLVSYSEEREKVFDFTVPHTMGNGVFLKRKGSPNIEPTGQLGGKEIVVMRSDATHDWLLRNGISENLVLTRTVPEALRALAAGKHDYALVPHLVGLLIVNELGLANLETTGPLINVHDRGYGFAVREGNSVLLAQFNEGLNIIKATGRYDEIYEKWFGIVDPKGIATAVIVRYVIWGAGGIAALIGLTLTWIVVLRRTVTLKTAEVRRARDDLELQVEERTRDLQKEITERKRTEEELGHFFDVSSDLICVANTDGYFARVNPVCEEMLGWKESEFVGKPFVDFIHPEDVDATLQEIERQLNGEPVRAFVNRYRCKDGSYRWLEWVATPAFGKTIFAIARDITERKQAEEVLSESEQRFRDFSEAASDWFWEMDETLHFTYGSGRFFQITGFEPKDVIGKTRTYLKGDADDEEKWICHWADLENRRPFRDFQYELTDPRGDTFHISISGQPVFDGDGAFKGYRGAGQDITERKRMEQEHVHAQKLQAVGQLTGGIAHDFNNLLQIIQSNLWLAQDNLEREDEPLDRLGTSELLAEAIKAGNRGAKLTQQLLAFSRKQTLSPETVDPNEMIERMTNLLGRTLGEGIEIETFLEDDIPPIHVDAGNLENAILNLALNAKGAMPKGGKLTITTSKRNLDRELATEDGGLPVGEYVEISVTDIGGGMSAETLDRAIEPFFTTKDVGEGSGLGLSMVYGFTKQSGGHMTIQSEVGKGTTVNILLPIAEAKAAAGGEKRKDAGAGEGRGTILVVEDDHDVRRITVMLLNKLGYDTLEAEDALSAIEILKNDDGIDLMFSDVVMPKGITGIELAREVSRTMGTKVLLTSGYPIAELEKSGLSESAFGFLKKPYTTEELSQAVKAIL